VPLDYQKPDAESIQLAVIKHPATDQSRRIGTLFFNPGGPGGPGTQDLPAWFSLFPHKLQQQFDIVSFDPRGVGTSTAVECFASDEDEHNFFAAVPQAFPVGAAEINTWNQAYARYSELCAQRNGNLLNHVSTADVARDMDLLRRAVGDSTMNYLGVSYGTILGAVYVNLFPDKVRAAVLDGNIDPSAWTNDNRSNVQHTITLRIGSDLGASQALKAFLKLCGETTRDQCAFSEGSADATQTKFNSLLERLKSQPIVLSGYRFTYAMLLNSINGDLFVTHPVGGFKGWSHLGQVLDEASKAPSVSPDNPGKILVEPADPAWISVACGDTPNLRSPNRYSQLATFSLNRAGDIGPALSWGDSPCATWKGKAAENYIGPWNRRTANPILIVGNTVDPSTPYENSVAMARTLSRARLLTVKGYGHTALLNPSQCANDYVAAYFTTGALPPDNTVCQQDQPPFPSDSTP
jgi:pimeloyl-ACP methyl ester carboxylesterase